MERPLSRGYSALFFYFVNKRCPGLPTRATEEEAEEPLPDAAAEGGSLSGGIYSSPPTTVGGSMDGALDGAGCFDDESF